MAKMRDSHLTVSQVAAELEMSADGVYKLIRRGKLKAVRVSERKTFVSRLALDSYRRRLNGNRPDAERPSPTASPADLRAAFERETGYTPEDWVADWKRERIADSAENAELLVHALGLRPPPRKANDRGRRRKQQGQTRQQSSKVAASSGRKARADARRKRTKQPA